MATFRKLPSGKTQAIIRIAGYKPVSKTFHNKHQANQWVKLTEDRLNAVTHISADQDHSIPDLLTLYLDTITHRACYSTDRYAQKPLCSHLKHYKVSTLTSTSIEEYIATRSHTVRSSTIRKGLGLLQRALKYVKSPFTIRLPKENNRRY